MPKYFIKSFLNEDYKEVTKEEYVKVERLAGFRSKFGPNEIATAAFSGSGWHGYIRYNEIKEL